MLPTFVIGLREGLEAALIVGIIAAFVRKQGRDDVLRSMFVGVGAAVALCVAVGVALEVVSRNLPQKQQEGLETVIGFLAVGMVTYMVVWMRQHSRDLKGQLEGLTSDALQHGASHAGRAMVAMAFLAVLREGFETVVFLLAAFNESGSGAAAGIGAVLGIVVAVALGYGIYRGGVHLNLSKFFRATGLVLVLVAAGLVLNGFHTAHEAGWLDAGQGRTIDLTWLVRPGSVQSSLLTGMLGIQPRPVVIEVIGWLAYLVPVGLFVAWPPGRSIPRRRVRGLATGTAVAAAASALVLVLAAPGAAPDRPTTATADGPVALVRTGDGDLALRAAVHSPAAGPAAGAIETIPVRATGIVTHAGARLEGYTASLDGRGAAGRPAALTLPEVATLNGGRLPLGVRPSTADGTSTVPVRYSARTTVTVWASPSTGRVVDVRWREVVRAAAVTPDGPLPLDGAVADATSSLPSPTVAGAAAAARHDADQLSRRADLHEWAWAAAVLAVLAAVVAVLAWRRPSTSGAAPVSAGSTGAPVPARVLR